MDRSRDIRYYLSILTFPGLALHEIAHAIFILLDPAVEFKEIKITLNDGGYVRYEYRDDESTVTRSFLRSYAPFYINSGASVYLVKKALQIDGISISSVTGVVLLYFFALSFGSKSLPSEGDAYGHWDTIKNNFNTRRHLTVILLSPIYLPLSVPGLIISKIRMYNANSYYIITILYPVVLILLTMLIELGYIKPISIVRDILKSYS